MQHAASLPYHPCVFGWRVCRCVTAECSVLNKPLRTPCPWEIRTRERDHITSIRGYVIRGYVIENLHCAHPENGPTCENMLWRPLREGIAKICAPPKSYYPRMITSETCTRGAPPGTAERDTTALRGFTRRDTFTQSQRAQSQRAKRGQKRDKFFSTLFSLSLVSLQETA